MCGECKMSQPQRCDVHLWISLDHSVEEWHYTPLSCAIKSWSSHRENMNTQYTLHIIRFGKQIEKSLLIVYN